jgi:hypothetical protein
MKTWRLQCMSPLGGQSCKLSYAEFTFKIQSLYKFGFLLYECLMWLGALAHHWDISCVLSTVTADWVTQSLKAVTQFVYYLWFMYIDGRKNKMCGRSFLACRPNKLCWLHFSELEVKINWKSSWEKCFCSSLFNFCSWLLHPALVHSSVQLATWGISPSFTCCSHNYGSVCVTAVFIWI